MLIGLRNTSPVKTTGFGFSNPATGNSSETFRSERTPLAPPPEPDFSELLYEYGQVPRRFNPRRATASYDDAIEQTSAISSQLSQNAATQYAGAQLRKGLIPSAAGAVAAQTRLAGNRQVADMRLERDKYQQEVKSQGASLAAQIASQLAQLRDSYAKTLADFNIQESAFAQRDSQFATTTNLEQERLRQAQQELELRLMLGDLEGERLAKQIEEKPIGQANRYYGESVPSEIYGNQKLRDFYLNRY